MKRLGIFGGTFDPVHCGHLLIAEWVRDACRLDRVLFVPSAVPPHKQEYDLTDQHHRLAMVQAAVASSPEFGVSDIENAKRIYSGILGYDHVVYDERGVFDDFTSFPGGDSSFRRTRLIQTKRRTGGFSRLFGSSFLELVQVEGGAK